MRVTYSGKANLVQEFMASSYNGYKRGLKPRLLARVGKGSIPLLASKQDGSMVELEYTPDLKSGAFGIVGS